MGILSPRYCEGQSGSIKQSRREGKMNKAILVRKGHKDYDGILWVMKAVSKEEGKIDKIEVKAHVMTATDGKRLHEYPLNMPEDFPDGLYYPFRVGKAIILIWDESGETYPDTCQVFPKEEVINKLEGIIGGKAPAFDEAYTKIIKAAPWAQTLQILFVKDMLSSVIPMDISIFGEGKQFLFTGEGRRGLIMPLRM